MTEPRYVVGIDLGTSNCALAYADLTEGPGAGVRDFPIPQVVRAGETAERPVLPSCLYLPAPGEWAPGAARLPWDPEPAAAVGEFARWQGARVPGRLVSSAKSWLCHPGVDREAAILPWGADPEVPKVSPVQASARFLAHLAAAWEIVHPDAPLSRQELVITVPASFDAVARALTERAANAAGLTGFTLVEEPQAAFGEFLVRHRDTLPRALAGIRLVLVVDVGGGTTDFTLIRVDAGADGPELRRVAVGDHLMLGGDNMDAAVARRAEQRVAEAGRRLGSAQWAQWVQACRMAKETLLADEAAADFRVAVAGGGSRLVGSTLAVTLERGEVEAIVLDGFLPRCGPDEPVNRGARVGLHELGLPYASDPAITRQLAAFLRAHRIAGWAALEGRTEGTSAPGSKSEPAGGGGDRGRGLPRPDALLVNGGVFRSNQLVRRLAEVVSGWWPAEPPIPVWGAGSLDLAVARGAAAHGLARRGWGRRVGGGAGHAFYIGFQREDDGAARALCVIPRGHEEGQAVELGGKVFRLRLGQPVRFPLFATTADRSDRAGDEVEVDDELRPLPPVQTVLRGGAGQAGLVPVHLRARLTEVGTLELGCVAEGAQEPWRLEFALREDSPGTQPAPEPAPLPSRLGEAVAVVETVFGRKAGGAAPPEAPPAKQTWGRLERLLGPRDQWRLPALRALWQALVEGEGRRRRSVDHERLFFQLAGYLLRPGYGEALDAWRCERLAALFSPGVQHAKEKAVWTEFWVMWRRVAGGLSPARHAELWAFLRPHLAHRIAPRGRRPPARPRGPQPDGEDEMLRLAGALEHLPADEKSELGGWLVARLEEGANSGGAAAWALGRLGARVPLYGSSHHVVPVDVASDWVGRLLAAERWRVEGGLFALVQLARRSGDRARDLDDRLREAVVRVLRVGEAPPGWERLVTEVAEMNPAEKARALGDALPHGLLG